MEEKEIKGRKGRKIKIPKNLPASDDDFWEDNEVNLIKEKELPVPEMKNHHPVYIKGGVFVCRGCPYEHTINLSTKKFTVKDGYIVKRS